MAVDDSTGTGVETCFHHTDRPTGRHCTRCGRPACPTCLRQAAVGSHCFECVREAAPPRREAARVRTVLAGHPLTATKALIGLNVAVFVLGIVLDGRLATSGELHRDFGIFGPAVDVEGEWWRIVTGGFLHAGLMHLAFNMVALWFLGRLLEPALGSPGFVVVYAAGLLGGSAGALALDPLALTVGASGAIFGLMGALFLGLRARGVDPFQAGIGGLLVVNLLITFAVPGISIGGHLGGLVAGGVAGWLLLRPSAERQRLAAAGMATLIGAASFWVALEAAGRWIEHL